MKFHGFGGISYDVSWIYCNCRGDLVYLVKCGIRCVDLVEYSLFVAQILIVSCFLVYLFGRIFCRFGVNWVECWHNGCGFGVCFVDALWIWLNFCRCFLDLEKIRDIS